MICRVSIFTVVCWFLMQCSFDRLIGDERLRFMCRSDNISNSSGKNRRFHAQSLALAHNVSRGAHRRIHERLVGHVKINTHKHSLNVQSFFFSSAQLSFFAVCSQQQELRLLFSLTYHFALICGLSRLCQCVYANTYAKQEYVI